MRKYVKIWNTTRVRTAEIISYDEMLAALYEGVGSKLLDTLPDMTIAEFEHYEEAAVADALVEVATEGYNCGKYTLYAADEDVAL